MKTIFRLTVLFSLVMYSESESLFAQVGVQAGVIIPSGDWSDFWSSGIGGNFAYKIEIGDGAKIGASIGYFSLQGKSVRDNNGNSFETGNSSLIPFLGTFDYQLSSSIFLGLDAGYNYISYEKGVFGFSTGSSFAAGNSAAIVPKIGVLRNKFSTELRYNVIEANYLSILVGYNF
jgi:hypothetical protein